MNWLLPEDGGRKLGSSMGALTLSNDDALHARTQRGTKTGGGGGNEEDRAVWLMVFTADKPLMLFCCERKTQHHG